MGAVIALIAFSPQLLIQPLAAEVSQDTEIQVKKASTKGCDEGMDAFIQFVLAIPYAIAYLALLIGGVLFFVFSLVVSLVLIVGFGLTFAILSLINQDTDGIIFMWDWSKSAFLGSLDLFDSLESLNNWYTGC